MINTVMVEWSEKSNKNFLTKDENPKNKRVTICRAKLKPGPESVPTR